MRDSARGRVTCLTVDRRESACPPWAMGHGDSLESDRIAVPSCGQDRPACGCAYRRPVDHLKVVVLSKSRKWAIWSGAPFSVVFDFPLDSFAVSTHSTTQACVWYTWVGCGMSAGSIWHTGSTCRNWSDRWRGRVPYVGRYGLWERCSRLKWVRGRYRRAADRRDWTIW